MPDNTPEKLIVITLKQFQKPNKMATENKLIGKKIGVTNEKRLKQIITYRMQPQCPEPVNHIANTMEYHLVVLPIGPAEPSNRQAFAETTILWQN